MSKYLWVDNVNSACLEEERWKVPSPTLLRSPISVNNLFITIYYIHSGCRPNNNHFTAIVERNTRDSPLPEVERLRTRFSNDPASDVEQQSSPSPSSRMASHGQKLPPEDKAHHVGVASASTIIDHETLKYHLLGPSLTKAGQDAVDQQKVVAKLLRCQSAIRVLMNTLGLRDNIQRL